MADLDQEKNTVAGLAAGPPVTLMPASPSANSFTSSQLRLPYSRRFVVLMRMSRPRLAPGETVTRSTVRSSLTSMGVRTRLLESRMNRSATVTFKVMFTVVLRIDPAVPVTVHPFDEVPQLELVRAVAPSGPLIGDEERACFVRHLELIRERGARQTAHDRELVPGRSRDDVPLGRRLDRIGDAVSVRIALGGPERQHRQRGTDQECSGAGRGGRKDNLP